MSASIVGLLFIAIMFVLLFLRTPVWLALAICGIAGNTALSNVQVAQFMAGSTTFDMASKYGLSVVPLFVLMGEIATSSRLSSELFSAARVIMSGLRGGLSVATICASGAFGAICGSSVATAATMTRIAMPEMRKAGYADAFSAGSVAAGGTLGILIPPSIILIIYGAIAEQSIPKLFAASMIPGIVLLILYAAIALFVAHRVSGQVPTADQVSFGERLKALLEPWQFYLLFIITIGGIYSGIFSPNEAAGVGTFAAIVISFLSRRLTVENLIRALRTTTITSAVLFMIIIGASMFANFVVQTRLPNLLIETAQAVGLGPLMIMTLIIILYIILGCFLEGIGMVLITVPVFLPIVTSYGYDPVWFGVLVVIVVELGLITPPVGMNLFIIQAQAPEVSLKALYSGIGPFLIAPVFLILLLFLLPGLALWLPAALY
ncbi:TRAP transporter large permease [Roseibium aggregatum]|uniref:TRAP transporter large permease protein n=1 Tax=Roseibium aggregatum TaxID=187304 RepID=A0A926S7F4_9HYPH|nr:TRAP transporter large permease [Roseibium aggregatum]MBD1548586.1 TRAP transporter large permease [Roseibium aggregatum]